MKHFYIWAKLLFAVVMLFSTSAIFAAPRSIYITGTTYGGDNFNYPPIAEYESYYKTLIETGDGTNIYTGTFNFIGNRCCFRFHTELFEGDEGTYTSSFGWYSNQIAPAVETVMDEIGNSGVFTSSGVYYPFRDNATVWEFAANEQGTYKVILDANNLNDVKVTLIPVYSYYVVLPNQPTPTLASIADFTPVSNPDFIDYFEAGTLSFSLYDLGREMWLNPSSNFTFEFNSKQMLEATESTSRGQFSLSDWPGGIVSLNTSSGVSTPVYELKPDKPVASSDNTTATVATVIGDFCGWDFYSAVRYFFDSPTSEFDIKIPAGACEWKLVLGTDWSALNFGEKSVANTADGSKVVALVRDGANITFDSSLSADITARVNLSNLTITFPASAPLTATSSDLADGSYPDNVDELLVETQGYGVTPWLGASAAVMNTVTHLAKQNDGTYKGSISLDRPFRFISSRAAKGSAYEVIVPLADGSNREIALPEDNGRSSAVYSTSDRGGWWTVPARLAGTNVDITVDTSSATPKITFYAESRKPGSANGPIYLVGYIQGWDVNKDSHPLYPTDNGGYYGAFPVESVMYGDMMFRFYTSLGEWDNNSFGIAVDDEPIGVLLDDYGTYEGTGCNGKGSWYIENWTGSTLYTYVNLNTKRVVFSNNPIAEAGNFITEYVRPERMWIYNEATGNYSKMNEVDEDIYSIDLYAKDITDYKFRLFSELPTVARDEADWGAINTYAASTSATAFDKFGVSEVSVSEYNGTITPEPIDVQLEDAIPYYHITFDKKAGKLYFERRYNSVIYLTGAISGNKELTYENRADWANLIVDANGGIFNIPAGKFDFVPVNHIYINSNGNSNETPVCDVVWDSNGVMVGPNNIYGIIGYEMRCDDWTGGDVAIKSTAIADFRSINEITAYLYCNNSENSAKLVKQSDGTFKGKLPYTDANALSYLSFTVKKSVPTMYGSIDFSIASIMWYINNLVGSEISVNEGCNVLRNSTGNYSAPIAFGGVSFNFPALSGNGELDITLNLDKMTMEVVNTGVEAPIYEAVADESSPLNGAIVTPSAENSDAMVMSLTTVASESPVEFNFVRPDGTVVVPTDGSVDMQFDNGGVYTGKFNVASTQRVASRASVRKAAASSAKWRLTLPEGVSSTDVNVMLNEADGTIAVFSSAHNKDVFYISWYDEVNQTASSTSLVNLNDGNSRKLVRNADGIFAGEFAAESDSYILSFHSIPDGENGGSGIAIPFGGVELTTFDLTANSEFTRPALTGNYYSQWSVKAPKSTVSIAYNPTECKLSMKAGSSSIVSVMGENETSLLLTAAGGCILVNTSVETLIEVYNVGGVLIKRTTVPAGHTTIPVASGFYIANGQKLLVK